MFRYALTTFALAGLLAPLPAGERPARAEPDEVRKRFYRCWLEVERVEGGVKTKGPDGLCGVQFGEKEYWVWARRGELSAGGGTTYRVRIDPTADPMRVDIVASERDAPPGRRETVQTGVFKFDGERLVVAVAPWRRLAPPGPGQDYPVRPTGFESTRENQVTVSTYTPTDFYGVD
jgi:hypothetical protein